jgi:hypothetical protein
VDDEGFVESIAFLGGAVRKDVADVPGHPFDLRFRCFRFRQRLLEDTGKGPGHIAFLTLVSSQRTLARISSVVAVHTNGSASAFQ